MMDHVHLILKVEYLAIPHIYFIVDTIALENIMMTLKPIISSNVNAPIVNATLNTQASNTEDL